MFRTTSGSGDGGGGDDGRIGGKRKIGVVGGGWMVGTIVGQVDKGLGSARFPGSLEEPGEQTYRWWWRVDQSSPGGVGASNGGLSGEDFFDSCRESQGF